MKRRKHVLIISMIVLFISLPVYSFGNKEVQNNNENIIEAKYNKIDAQTAQNIFTTQEDFTIIDVRTESEYESGHVKNSINIPLNILEKEILDRYPDKGEKLYLYCRSGNRSAQAARLLVSNGYFNVYDFGGIIDWPYEIVK